MFRGSEAKLHDAIRVERTAGDFPHVRRRNVWLACCTTTTCCLTILLGAGGGLIGLITGTVRACQSQRPDTENVAADIAIGLGRVVLFAFVFAVLGILIGAAIGFVLDQLVLA